MLGYREKKSYRSYAQIWCISASLKILSCWLWVRVATSHHAWPVLWCLSGRGEKKRAAEYYSSYKNAGLCRAGFGFPGHPVLNYSLKASAQLVEFVWIAWEAERVVAKTLELFVSLQFIQIKRPASRTEDISDYIFFPVLVHSQGVRWCLYWLSVCDILRLCFTYATSSPSDHHVHIGLWGPASRGGLNPSSGRSFTAH